MERTKKVLIYTRVSTAEQSVAPQETALREFAATRGWEVKHVYSDKGISGGKDSRPALNELMTVCRKQAVDVVLVWKFDRFARSLRHLVAALEEFKGLRIDFISATEGVDTTVPSGELVFQIFGAIAQFERSLIAERVRAGMAEAKRRGIRIGRPPIKKLTIQEALQVREARAQGMKLRPLAKEFGTSLWAVHRACLEAAQ